ncbi:MAG: anti-sigma-factor antagonist [Bryobacterales bacterium]|nr:anti-sigma-factor antagonist [Bryobacterales bacterium]
MSLSIEHKEIAPATRVISINGKLLLGAGCVELESLVPQLVAAGARNLVFDLSGVTRIDSTGIGRFIDTYGRLKKSGGQMRLAGATGGVMESFRLTRLDSIFSFYPTVEAACEGLAVP